MRDANSRPLSLWQHRQQLVSQRVNATRHRGQDKNPTFMVHAMVIHWPNSYSTQFDRNIACEFRTRPKLGRLHISFSMLHDDVIKWKHFPRYWPFVRGIHRSRWIPHTKASDAELWCFLWSAPEKRLSKQSRGWWFETPSHPIMTSF